MIIHDVSADLRGQAMISIIRTVKGDTNRQIRVYLRDGGKTYAIAEGSYAVLMGKKPDGTAVFNNCRIESNMILYDFTDQTCAVEGSYPVQIRLYGPDQKTITTVPIQIDVYGTAFDAEAAAASADEQTALDDLVNRTRALQLEIIHDRDTRAYQGESAYEIAVRLGFQGSEAEWIDSLRYDHSEEFAALAEQVRQSVAAASGFASAAQAQAEEAARQAGLAGAQMTAAKAQADEAARQAGIAAEQVTAARDQASSAAGSAADAKAQAGIAVEQAQSAKLQAQEAARQKDLAADQVTAAQTQAAEAAGSMEAAKAEADRAKSEADRSVGMGVENAKVGQFFQIAEIDSNGHPTRVIPVDKPGEDNGHPWETVVDYTTTESDADSVDFSFTAKKYPKLRGWKQFFLTVQAPAPFFPDGYNIARIKFLYHTGIGIQISKLYMPKETSSIGVICDGASGIYHTSQGYSPEVGILSELTEYTPATVNQTIKPVIPFDFDMVKVSLRACPVGTRFLISVR